MKVEQRLKELGFEVSAPAAPMANYVPAVRTGNLVFVSGNGPRRPDGSVVTGKVGKERTEEEGYEAARVTIVNCLAAVKGEVGDLDRVVRVVKLLGMVNCTEDFQRQPQVVNGASDLLVEVFGERGRHARSAVGMQSLPMGITVEIEMIVEVE